MITSGKQIAVMENISSLLTYAIERHLDILPGSGEAVFPHLDLERVWLELEVITDMLFGFNILFLYRSVNR